MSNNVAIQTVTAAILLSPVTATAQMSFTPAQCRDALVIGNAVMTKYAISSALASSFREFRVSGCDPKTVFNRDTDTDETAFGEFRLKLIALRTER